MLATVFGKTLRDERRSLTGWLIGITLLVAWVIAFWPAMEDSMGDWSQVLEDMPEAFRAMMGGADFTTARGFLSAELFSFMLPVIIAILGIGKAARVVAGEEERGDLELLVVRPITRRRLALEKISAVLVTIAAVVAVAFVVTTLGVTLTGMDVAVAEIGPAMLGLGLLGWMLAAVSYAVGAGTGRRGLAIAVASVVALLTYLATTFAPLVEGLRWLEDASPWTWAFGGDALREGPSMFGVLGLLVLTAGLIAAGTWRFLRRDIGT